MTFDHDIKPLLRDEDRDEMSFAFDLWTYDDVAEYAASILDRVEDGTMPCDEPWPRERTELFAAWIDSRMPR